MADKKISQLSNASTPLAGTEVLPIVQSGSTVQVSVANLTAGRTVASATLTVDANSSSDAVRITQTGSGNALLVEDSSNPDSTPFVINASGNVGIGTSSPDALLSVNTVASFGAGAVGAPSIAAKGDLDTGVWFPAANNFAVSTGATERLRIDNAGNVGIGTTSPGNKLDVVSAGSSQIRVKDGVNATAYYDFGRDGTDGFFGFSGAQTTYSGYKWSVNAGTEVMRITNDGNIVAGKSVALATTATNGFLYVPTCAGLPTGTPTAITGMAPIVVDTTNNKLYFYSNGAWRDAGP